MDAYLHESITIEMKPQLSAWEQVSWAREQLAAAAQAAAAGPAGERIAVRAMTMDNPAARAVVEEERLDGPDAPEAFALVRKSSPLLHAIYVVGHDARGAAYGLLELADIIRCSGKRDQAWSRLAGLASRTEKTDMPVRSIVRLFVSEREDKRWYYNQAFWDEYLTELAMQRFNRFQLALGIGYDSGHDPAVVDNYFCFAYPFLLQLPQYEVKALHLPSGEIERILAALQYIGEQARRRGLHFQLGLWTHAYQFPDSPNVRYPVQGLTSENHAAYCRDALKALLQACPAIDGITLRVHYESGIPEPASEFWRVVMEGAERDGKRIELDMHAKGVDEQLIDTAVQSGSPVLVSAKYAAEHMGLPYHQADIRALEKPRTGGTELGFDALTAAARRFTRYGYGDFLRAGRSYDVIYRVWPGTQRVLLWGDPALAAGFGRWGRFGGAKGIEWFEPLSFKARKDSGAAGGRELYADPPLQLHERDWRKYRITYRLWGRLIAFGYKPYARGHWRDRLEGIREDIAEMERICTECLLSNEQPIIPFDSVSPLTWKEPVEIRHSPPDVRAGEPAALHVHIRGAREGVKAEVHYRIAHQALAYEVMEMTSAREDYYAVIPPASTSAGYPVIYYFIIKEASGAARQWPGFRDDLSNQPYFVLPLTTGEGEP